MAVVEGDLDKDDEAVDGTFEGEASHQHEYEKA